jgi:hypothetical protein
MGQCHRHHRRSGPVKDTQLLEGFDSAFEQISIRMESVTNTRHSGSYFPLTFVQHHHGRRTFNTPSPLLSTGDSFTT